MFYRECGVRHTNYVSDRAIASIPFERWLLGVLLAAAVLAPLYISDLFLVSYLTPWLLWSAAALGLNLLMGLAGQIHLGYARSEERRVGKECRYRGAPYNIIKKDK